jgi:hypothetical protein
LGIFRKALDELAGDDGIVMIALNDQKAALPHRPDAFHGVGTIADDIPQHQPLPDPQPVQLGQHGLQGRIIGVDVAQQGKCLLSQRLAPGRFPGGSRFESLKG